MDWILDSTYSENVQSILGILSGLLSTYAYLPYIRDTLSGKTKPQRASWLIWSILGSIAFFSQLHEGATFSLWFAGVQISGTIIVFILSIWAGSGRFLKGTDYIVIALAAAGLVIWFFTDTAVYALLISISISLLGGSVTILKAYNDPNSETMSTWVISLFASICALVAVGKIDFILLAYPLYLLTLNSMIVVAIQLGKITLRQRENVLSTVQVDIAL